MRVKTVAWMVALTVLAGCGSTGWKSEYSCPGMPDGVTCKSPVEVYKMTENRDRVTRDGKDQADAPAAQPADTVRKLLPAMVPTNRGISRDALPVLEPAKVMRVWVAPWIDAKQDLHMPGYLITEVTPRRCSFGESTAVMNKPLVPLQTDMPPDESVAVGDPAKVLTPKGLVQGMDQQGSGLRMTQSLGASAAGMFGAKPQQGAAPAAPR